MTTTEAETVEAALGYARSIIAESVRHPDWFISREDQPRLIMARALETLSARVERLRTAGDAQQTELAR